MTKKFGELGSKCNIRKIQVLHAQCVFLNYELKEDYTVLMNQSLFSARRRVPEHIC